MATPYLQRWGKDWQRTAPFRFNYYREDEATKEQPSLVIMSQVLPNKFNIGSHEYRGYAAGDTEQAANRRILERFGITAAVQITPKSAAAN